MMHKINYSDMVEKAIRVSSAMESWAEFADFLFNQETGLLATSFQNRDERNKFAKSPECRQIQTILQDLMLKHGVVRGATPTKSGRFVVRMPKTLHVKLEQEAQNEHVSLNQLVVAKLALSLGEKLKITAH